MESVINRIKKGLFWKFHGGVHPPERKFLTNKKPIRTLPLPALLTIPVTQHIGSSAVINVQIGDKVLKGQPLTLSDNPMAVPVHAPTSGEIVAIKPATIAHPSGLAELCIQLKPDGKDTWRHREVCNDFRTLGANEIINKIADAGIAGMGGAGFPTHIKVGSKQQVNYLIINGVECEPYITADDLLMREQSNVIVEGIKILNHLLKPQHILLAIEKNKPLASDALTSATADIANLTVCNLPVKYPAGGEKQLIQQLTGQEVPVGTLPIHMGIVLQNVATCFAIADAVLNDIPLIQRVVTVTGEALAKPQNVWALIGTPVEHLLHHCDYQQSKEQQAIIMGGPMMGFTLPSLSVPIIKTSNCIIAATHKEISTQRQEKECVRCGQCADACPAQLLPQELQWYAKAKDHQQLNALNLFDCIECGACAYVCPSQIPLVHYYRVAKADIRQRQQLDLKAEKAKQRFEARKQRLEKEKQKREEKHRLAAESRRAAMNKGTPEAENAKSAVAAALARVKAKKAQASEGGVQAMATDNATPADVHKAQVADAIARVKAKKALTNNSKSSTDGKNTSSEHTDNVAPQKNTQVADAIARIKAKKALQKSSDSSSESLGTENEKQTSNDEVNDNKAKASRAVERIKAKQQAAKKNLDNKLDTTTSENSAAEPPLPQKDSKPIKTKGKADNLNREDKIRAAVEKAKAKRQQTAKDESDVSQQQSLSDNSSVNNAEKAKRIAEAIAKAKAKKQQQVESK